jgi:tetratricopeptide (TPR) repeat protein
VAPHLERLGSHTTPTTGNGTIRVQVQVNADGTHSVTRIISSTNHNDDQAAREVAASSSYRSATCSGRAMTYFYDPIFHFTGSTVSSSEIGGAGGGGAPVSGAAARVQGLIRSGDYDTARSVAQSALANAPNDRQLIQLLGIADYYAHDYSDAADAFARIPGPYMYPSVAAQALATAAVVLSDTDPQRALSYAQRALSIDHSANSRFALGDAQLGNKDYATAIATLQQVRSEQAHDPHVSERDRYRLDEVLLKAYVGNNDVADAQPIVEEMHRLEPSGEAPTAAIGQAYLMQGQAALTAKEYEQAIALFEKVAALGDPRLELEAYDDAAFAVADMPQSNATRLKAYADKALALNADDPRANFMEGIALIEQYNATRNATVKQQALTYLNKADAEAKAAGNTTLAHNIESVLTQFNGTGGMP